MKNKESLIATGSIFGADPSSIDLDFIIKDQGKIYQEDKNNPSPSRSMAFDPNIIFLMNLPLVWMLKLRA